MTKGEKIRIARENKPLTQTELGMMVFPDKTSVAAQKKMARIESGQKIKAKELDAICEALGDKSIKEGDSMTADHDDFMALLVKTHVTQIEELKKDCNEFKDQLEQLTMIVEKIKVGIGSTTQRKRHDDPGDFDPTGLRRQA